MNSRRVVITGLGTVNPLGHDVPTYWQALLAGENGIGRITRFDVTGLPVQIAGEVKDFDPLQRLSRKEVRRQDLYTVFALYAAAEALEDARLDQVDPYRVGVIIASGIGGVITLEQELRKMVAHGPEKVSPFLVPMMIPDMAAGAVAMKYGFKGPNFCVVSACASATNAIGEAFRMIQRGDADVIVTGGAEAPLTPLAVAGFSNMRALSTRNDEPHRASRPFDAERDGFVMGEGAGIVVLESLDHARRRGARIYAEITGYGATEDAHHITAPHPEGEGAYRSMQLALASAGLQPEEIDYINAHGTSTPLNDKIETLAIKRLFGEHAYKIPISSTKSMIGHLLGASGGAEFIATVLSVYHQRVHPTRNLEHPDPECDLDYVPEGAREVSIRHALTNSFGFGGHNATLVVSRFEE